MASSKLKIAAVGTGVVILAIGLVFLGGKAVRAVRNANAPDLQGNWTGNFEFKETKMPLMYKISRVNGAYHAVEVNIYQGAREMPVSRLVYNYPSVRIEQQAIGFTYEATLNKDTMEMSGTWKQNNGSGPFTMKRTANPEGFPEPMAESDYAPRKGSDLQGYWKGTLKPGNTPIRVEMKMSERADGTFRVVGDSPDQGARDIEATAVTYHRPSVKVEFGGIGGYFEGTMDENGRAITGNWMQGGKPLALTLERAKPEAAPALDPALELLKDYSHALPTDLPGHWKGTLNVKQGNLKLRLALNIAKMPDGKFSCSVISLDQGDAEIPASMIQYLPPNVRVEWGAIGAAFHGKLENGKLSGAWRQGGGALPVIFERGASE